jgi:hypothetical protein
MDGPLPVCQSCEAVLVFLGVTDPIMEPLVRQVLEDAGWREDRTSAPMLEIWKTRLKSSYFEMFPAAARALSAFGGLNVVQRGAGINMPRDGFDLNPELAYGEEKRFERFAAAIGQRLFPLGEGGAGHYFLAIAEDGRIFAIAEGIELVGASIEEAVENLIVGRRGASLNGP